MDLHEVNGSAPEPMLGVGVRQGGQLVTGELNVNPGTPLQMEIFLDKNSAPVYGLLVSYMQVTDTKLQEETIIFNGWVAQCQVWLSEIEENHFQWVTEHSTGTPHSVGNTQSSLDE